MTRQPTEAEVEALIHQWIREDLSLAMKMMIRPEHVKALIGKIIAAEAEAKKNLTLNARP